MAYIKFKGKRSERMMPSETITIFFMSFVYPATTGYLKRMDFLIRWADNRFSTVNFIFPNKNVISNEVIEEHLRYCNNLFLVDNDLPKFPKLFSIQKLAYKLIFGRYPKFDSPLFLNKSLGKSFEKVVNEYKTDFFLNTRNNFGGLVSFIPKGTVSIFDTQDIFTEMHRKYGMKGKREWLQKILLGYREKGEFVKSEIEILTKYDKVIAISESDYQKYYSILPLQNKLCKIESIGIEAKEYPVSTFKAKEFDCLIVASNFIATQEGVKWFFNEVTPFFSNQISLCVVGSICDYIESENLNHPKINLFLKGFVNEIDEYYNKSKVVSLLMLSATGTSVKGIEALAFGAAIVSTTSGVRFGGLENGNQCMIADTPKEFANAIELLINDKQKRFILGEKALEFAKERMSIDTAFKLLDSCIY
jgi:glycosyltransferase involved in cell wall biosynthesis